MYTPAPNISPRRDALWAQTEISVVITLLGERVVVPARVEHVGVHTLYVTVLKNASTPDRVEFNHGWYGIDNVEGVAWCYGLEGEAVDALKVAVALR